MSYPMVNIFFKINGVAQSGSNIGTRYSRYSSFAISSYHLELIHSANQQPSAWCCGTLFSGLNKQFPEFSDDPQKKFKLVSHDSNGDLILLDTARDLYALVCSNKEKCMTGVAIPLAIVEWPPKSSAVTENGTACKKIGCCRECGNDITDFIFQCIECDDCDLCGSCITSGKHPQHMIICSINSKVDRETMAKKLEASITKTTLVLPESMKKMETEIKLQNSETRRLSRRLEEMEIMMELQPAKRAWNPLEDLTTNKFKRINIEVKRLSDSSVTTEKDSQEKGTQTESQIFSIEQPLVSIATSSSDVPELFTTDNMFHLEEISVADAQQSILNTTLDDGVEEDGYDVINQTNQDEEDGARIKSGGSSNNSGTVLTVNDTLLKNGPISHQAANFLIEASLKDMLDMGFTDEGGWLSRLLEVKGGIIDDVLNALTPF